MLIEIESTVAISYASYHAGVPVVSQLALTNDTNHATDGFTGALTIPGYMTSEVIEIGPIGPGVTYAVPPKSITISFFEDNLRSIAEKVKTSIELRAGGETVARQEIWLLPYDEWSLEPEHRPALAAFVQPNSPVVRLVERRALKQLEQLTSKASFEALLDAEPQSRQIKQAVEAVYECLRTDFEITYAQAPVGYEATYQKVRLPDQTIYDEFGGKGTCIDLALLMAACLESLHLQPLISIIQLGPFSYHALLGCWLRRAHRTKVVYTDAAELLRLMDSGELLMLDCTGFARDHGGGSRDFEVSIQEGSMSLRDHPLLFALDVEACRFDDAVNNRQRITPMPFHGQSYFSEAALNILNEARRAAQEFPIEAPGRPGRCLLASPHLLLALLSLDQVTQEMFEQLGVEAELVRDKTRDILGASGGAGPEIVETQTYRRIKELSKLHVRGDRGIRVEECQLLLAMFSIGGRSIENILSSIGKNIQECLIIIEKLCPRSDELLTAYSTYLDA